MLTRTFIKLIIKITDLLLDRIPKISVLYPAVNITLPDKLMIVTRQKWLAQPLEEKMNELVLPISHVVISHTATEDCTDQAPCVFYVKKLQNFHIESNHFKDIAYNFLVAGDGNAYEGRGWKYEGENKFGYNSKSLGVAFIGTFHKTLPLDRQRTAAKQLIEIGVELGHIAKDYKLFGERQLVNRSSPGIELFEEIKTWPHWSGKEF